MHCPKPKQRYIYDIFFIDNCKICEVRVLSIISCSRTCFEIGGKQNFEHGYGYVAWLMSWLCRVVNGYVAWLMSWLCSMVNAMVMLCSILQGCYVQFLAVLVMGLDQNYLRPLQVMMF